MGLIPAICTILCFLLSACDSADDSIKEDVNNFTIKKIHLSNGEIITLSDTTVYVIDADTFNDAETISEKSSENLFTPDSRSTSIFKEFGYDSQEPETGWKKYIFNNWETYGVLPGLIYVGRYVKVHKNLPIEPGTYAMPANYTSANAPKNAMGWNGQTEVIGFTPTAKSDNIADGVTRIFFLKCDLAGKEYNKMIPANPSDFQWVYALGEKIDIWK